MKTYVSNRRVQAGRITSMRVSSHSDTLIEIENGRTLEMSQEWVGRNKPLVGGFVVTEESGYRVFMPYSLFNSQFVEELDDKLPQSEGATWFMVVDDEGCPQTSYTAEFGRSYGYEWIKKQQEIESVAGWKVIPVYSEADLARVRSK